MKEWYQNEMWWKKLILWVLKSESKTPPNTWDGRRSFLYIRYGSPDKPVYSLPQIWHPNPHFMMILWTRRIKSCVVVLSSTILLYWTSDLLLLENNHMDPNGSENPIQSLPCCQDVSMFINDWENIVWGGYVVVLGFKVCCVCTSKRILYAGFLP